MKCKNVVKYISIVIVHKTDENTIIFDTLPVETISKQRMKRMNMKNIILCKNNEKIIIIIIL